ncbi:MAG: LuxR C-terminal-related transcriptional regulator [Planctomycetota bacterium]
MLDRLTPREREVLTLIGEGYSLPEIAQQLHRSVKTIETHRLTLGRKLDAGNRVALAKIAISAGLVNLDASNPVGDNGTRTLGSVMDHKPSLLDQYHAIDERTGVSAGAHYLRLLAIALTEVLDMDCAGICDLHECSGTIHNQALFVAEGDELGDTMTYAMRGTPCEDAYLDGEAVCPAKVTELYPQDQIIAQMNLESYIGLRLDAQDGRPIGILWLMDTEPLEHPEEKQALLRMVARRCTSELERSIDVMHELERIERRESIRHEMGLPKLLVSRSNTRLDSLLNVFQGFSRDMPVAVIAFDNETAIHFNNPAAEELFGYEEGGMIGTSIFGLFSQASVKQYRAEHAHACEVGEALQLQLEGQRRDGSVFPVALARSGLFDEHGRVCGTIVLLVEQAAKPASVAPAGAA